MIEDKKIEEAARYYCSNRYHASQDAPFIAEGFRHGAKWMREEFLKDLWHPASEEPRKGARFLHQTTYHGNFYYYVDVIDDILQTYPNWSSYIRHIRVVQWLYIDDLLPKEGGEK